MLSPRPRLIGYLRRTVLHVLEVVVLPAVVLARLISPVVLIRFGRMHGRIGHQVINTELYLCRRDLERRGRPCFDFFDLDTRFSNGQMVRMLRRQMRISRMVAPFYFANRRIPGYRRHEVPLSAYQDTEGLLSRARVHLEFTEQEEERGRRELAELGVLDGAPFVCFHSRDGAYRAAVTPGYNWRLSYYRNTDVKTFVPAARELARLGYTVFRMGSVVAEPLEDAGPGVIDYASSTARSDFLDVYLAARCRFWLGTPSGLNTIPISFRKPVAHVNCIPLGGIGGWCTRDLFIPKKLWLRSEKRFLTLAEILDSPIGWAFRADDTAPRLLLDQYHEASVEIVDNSPDEITALAVEMHERLEGTWEACDQNGDDQIHSSLKELLKRGGQHGQLGIGLGSTFIRMNPELVQSLRSTQHAGIAATGRPPVSDSPEPLKRS